MVESFVGGGGWGGGYPLCHGAGTEVVESFVGGGGDGGRGYPLCHGAGTEVVESFVGGGGDGVGLPLVSWRWH